MSCDSCSAQTPLNRCPQGHSYCDSCAVVICINPGTMLANDFNCFCPKCEKNTDAKQTPQPPNAFFCPITHALMREPSMIEDGVSYEHDAITRWLETHDTSPTTNVDVDSEIIIKNTNLKNIIGLWLEAHGKKHEDFD